MAELAGVGQFALVVPVEQVLRVPRDNLSLGQWKQTVFEETAAVVLRVHPQAHWLRHLPTEDTMYVVCVSMCCSDAFTMGLLGNFRGSFYLKGFLRVVWASACLEPAAGWRRVVTTVDWECANLLSMVAGINFIIVALSLISPRR